MDLNLAHSRAQRVLRQRNWLVVLVIVLGVSLAATFTVAQSRDREVVLVPALRSPLTLSSTGVSREYLELVTRDVSALALNRSPETLTWWKATLLDLTDERTRGQVDKDLMKIVTEQQGSQISQFFTPDMMTVDPARLTSEVGGMLHTIVASKDVTSEHRTFRFRWTYNGVSLKLAGFGMVKRDTPAPGAAQ